MLREGTTENGVFAAKVMWGYFEEAFGRIEPLIPSPRIVWMRREDVLAQAVSWSRAIQGGRWWPGETRPEGSLAYDFAQIDALVTEAKEHDAAWHSWFAANDIDPFEVRYEELAADPAGIASGVLAFLRLSADSETIAPQNERQADELNADWAARYRADKFQSRHTGHLDAKRCPTPGPGHRGLTKFQSRHTGHLDAKRCPTPGTVPAGPVSKRELPLHARVGAQGLEPAAAKGREELLAELEGLVEAVDDLETGLAHAR